MTDSPEFRLHTVRLGSRFYLLLPKLNEAQVLHLEKWFAGRGMVPERNPFLVVRSKSLRLHINPSGYCWSTTDPSDFVGPVVPELLEFPKQKIPIERLECSYFRVQRSPSSIIIRISSRMENSMIWRRLRAGGLCALSPDERRVASFLARYASGRIHLLTDFPNETSHPLTMGKRRYYESFLTSVEVESTLCEVGLKFPRNSYLFQGGIVLKHLEPPPREKLVDLFENLGEWCYFMPA